MKKYVVLVLLIATLLSMVSCDWFAEDLGPSDYFYLENRSDETIYSFYQSYNANDKDKNVIDRSLYPWDTIRVSGSLKYGIYGKKQVIEILVLKQSTIDKISRSDMNNQHIADKRYILSYSDLKSMGFKIIYTDDL